MTDLILIRVRDLSLIKVLSFNYSSLQMLVWSWLKEPKVSYFRNDKS
jgi:hypothetical protein